MSHLLGDHMTVLLGILIYVVLTALIIAVYYKVIGNHMPEPANIIVCLCIIVYGAVETYTTLYG